jgi:hypothetical protein
MGAFGQGSLPHPCPVPAGNHLQAHAEGDLRVDPQEGLLKREDFTIDHEVGSKELSELLGGKGLGIPAGSVPPEFEKTIHLSDLEVAVVLGTEMTVKAFTDEVFDLRFIRVVLKGQDHHGLGSGLGEQRLQGVLLGKVYRSSGRAGKKQNDCQQGDEP